MYEEKKEEIEEKRELFKVQRNICCDNWIPYAFFIFTLFDNSEKK